MKAARDKILSADALAGWRHGLQRSGRTLVATNGCFDVLHAGHVTYLEAARSLGDELLVGLNSDASVRALKGPERPINGEQDRALLLAALGCVSAVTVFGEARSGDFLRRVLPEVYVKGGDYNLETIDQDDRRIVEGAGGRIAFIPFLPGRSTTDLISRIRRL